jgi:hypothetical protein
MKMPSLQHEHFHPSAPTRRRRRYIPSLDIGSYGCFLTTRSTSCQTDTLQQALRVSKLIGNRGRFLFNRVLHVGQISSKDGTDSLSVHALQVFHVSSNIGQARFDGIDICNPTWFHTVQFNRRARTIFRATAVAVFFVKH